MSYIWGVCIIECNSEVQLVKLIIESTNFLKIVLNLQNLHNFARNLVFFFSCSTLVIRLKDAVITPILCMLSFRTTINHTSLRF
jgi:hypothetical protein